MNYNFKTKLLPSNILKKAVKIIIVLPNNYDVEKSYDTYLAFDGIDLITNANQNILSNITDEKIIIGISCDDNIERFNNWSTYHNKNILEPMTIRYPEIKVNTSYLGGNGFNFINFISEELLAYLKNQEKLNIKALNIIGCSMGAYFCLQLLYLSNLTFNNALLLSPSIWFNEAIIDDLTNKQINNNQPLKIHLWVGLKEPKLFEKVIKIDYYQDSLKTKNALANKTNIDISFTVDPNGSHGFKWWINYINENPNIW